MRILQDPGLYSMERRGHRGDLIQIFKIVKGLRGIEACDI